MCTLFIFIDQKMRRYFAGKTVDTSPTQLSFQRITTVRGSHLIAFQMGWQRGINSGMNEDGLVIMSSYMGWEKASFNAHKVDFSQDTRGLANLEVLDRYMNTWEAISGLRDFLIHHQSSVGGIHFLLDKNGIAGILEHNNGQIEWKVFDFIDTNFLVRANNCEFIDGYNTNLEDYQIKDREDRINRTRNILNRLVKKNLKNGLKFLLSDCTPNRFGNGQICVKDYFNNGERSIEKGLLSTETALIFENNHKKFSYSDGFPWEGKWREMGFN